MSGTLSLSLGQCATLACLYEATAGKPGNVHRGADFEGLTYLDFVSSAMVIGPVFETAQGVRVGATILAAVKATQQAVATNTNLGTLLLLGPLAAVPRDQPLRTEIPVVLDRLNADDCRDVYEAIRLANPGGLGKVPEADVAAPPPTDLVAAMRLAADRDLVARQYANGFEQVLAFVLPALASGAERGWPLGATIIRAHLELIHSFPDSLIARKCGLDVAQQSSAYAGDVLRAGQPGNENYHEALADFDFWLRADGHRRNPGTSADLVAAGLFAALRDGIIKLPVRFYD